MEEEPERFFELYLNKDDYTVDYFPHVIEFESGDGFSNENLEKVYDKFKNDCDNVPQTDLQYVMISEVVLKVYVLDMELEKNTDSDDRFLLKIYYELRYFKEFYHRYNGTNTKEIFNSLIKELIKWLNFTRTRTTLRWIRIILL